MNRLYTESEYPEAVKRWTLEDWETLHRSTTADLRMLETVVLQVEQGLLPRNATESLGYNWAAEGAALSSPGFGCLWPEVSWQVSPSVREIIERSTPAADRVACPVDLRAQRDETILGGISQ